MLAARKLVPHRPPSFWGPTLPVPSHLLGHSRACAQVPPSVHLHQIKTPSHASWADSLLSATGHEPVGCVSAEAGDSIVVTSVDAGRRPGSEFWFCHFAAMWLGKSLTPWASIPSKNLGPRAPGGLSPLSVASDFGSGHDLVVHEFEPRVGLCADGSEPGACFGFGSPSLCPLPVHTPSLSLKNKLTLKNNFFN